MIRLAGWHEISTRQASTCVNIPKHPGERAESSGRRVNPAHDHLQTKRCARDSVPKGNDLLKLAKVWRRILCYFSIRLDTDMCYFSIPWSASTGSQEARLEIRILLWSSAQLQIHTWRFCLRWNCAALLVGSSAMPAFMVFASSVVYSTLE